LTTSNDFEYIDSDTALANFCTRLAQSTHCAVDTEFVRESTYYPILSLIQIAGNDCLGCIDPLAIEDFGPLIKILGKPDLLKIFHSPSQDLEILYQKFGQVPNPIFDTQLACAVLGYNHQISYADAVQQVTGVQLEKKYTRTDWSKRPLSPAQLDYAMDDVRYLLPVYAHLLAELQSSQREQWMARDLQAMSDPANYEVDMAALWKRLKGVQKLKGERLQIASDLCCWREKLAQQQNRPRRWIVRDEALVEIARQKPGQLEDLKSIPELPEKSVKRHGETLLQIVADAPRFDPEQWPRQEKFKQLNAAQMALGDCLMALCRVIAEENQIALATLATRKDIDGLVLNQKNSRLTQGWRFAMAGEQLLNFIHGQSSLRVDNQKLRLVTNES
jgi:ribonuclease D